MPISNYDMFDIQEWNMYRDSYYFMEGHPMVKQLKKENKKLKKEIANLKTMLMITQENMKLMLKCNEKPKNKKTKQSNKLYTDIDVNQESVDSDCASDIMQVSQNIKYEIVEDDVVNDTSDSNSNIEVEETEEVGVEEAGEEEVEVEEAGGEEEVEVEEAGEEAEVEEAGVGGCWCRCRTSPILVNFNVIS